ncbi:MAG: arsenite methyltransferase [Nitrospinae bacterium]|nr:arsenite methyltransferase [Nitrospinota bacterium]
MSAGCCDDAGRIKSAVRELYAKVAAGEVTCCGEADAEMPMGAENVESIGYAKDAVGELPPDVLSTNAGCGNPILDAAPRPGETVLDLGSGAGLDCFLAAKEVGPEGSAIGLDMTDAMLDKAERNRRSMGLQNVSFRKGEMENMPMEDGSVDVVISNCVINLSPDKPAVFRESFRVLRPGGRFVVSDVIRAGEKAGDGTVDPPAEASIADWCACIAGAIGEDAYVAGLREAGFIEVEIINRKAYVAPQLASATIRALKP